MVRDESLSVEEVMAYAAKRGFDLARTEVRPVIQERFPNFIRLSGIFENGVLVATLRKRGDGRYSYSNNVGTVRVEE